MKPFYSLLLLTLAAVSSLPAKVIENSSLSKFAYVPSSKPKLQLTTTVVEEVSCTSNLLSLHLRFTFTNIGSVPIILDKRSSIVAVHYVSRDVQAAARKKYVEVVRNEYDAGPDIPDTLDVPKDMSDFVILQPREFYEVESPWTRVHFSVNDGSPHSEAGLEYCSYILQVDVGTWLYAPDSVAEKAGKKWRDKGYLWHKPLLSLPMPFTVDKNRPIRNCR